MALGKCSWMEHLQEQHQTNVGLQETFNSLVKIDDVSDETPRTQGVHSVTTIRAVGFHSGRVDLNFGAFQVLTHELLKGLKTRHFQPVTVPLESCCFATYSCIDKTQNIDGNVFQYGGFVYTSHNASKVVVLQISKTNNSQTTNRVISTVWFP